MTGPVLCAVDISNPHRDDNVLAEAARLAALDGRQLVVVTVVPAYGMSVVGSYFDQSHHDKVVEHARELLGESVTAALGAEAGNSVRQVVTTGSAYDEILRVAEKIEASLIVIGAHKPDFKDYLLGPNAARVVRHSSCSVYVVR